MNLNFFLWFEWLPVSGQACFLSFLLSQQKQSIFHPFVIPERFLTTTGVKALGSEDCVFMKLRIQQINWTLLRSDRADKCENEKSYIFATSLGS